MGGAQFIGRVVSNRMQKTVVVAVDYMAYLPKLKTYEKRTAKHFAHADPSDLGGAPLDVGDVVRIRWTQRMSKHKHYKVSEVLRKANVYSAELGAAAAAARGAAGAAARGQVEVAEAAMEAAKQRLRALRETYEQQYGGSSGGGGSSGSGSGGEPAAEDGGGGAGRAEAAAAAAAAQSSRERGGAPGSS